MGCAVRFIIVLLCHPYAYAYFAANHIDWKITVRDACEFIESVF